MAPVRVLFLINTDSFRNVTTHGTLIKSGVCEVPHSIQDQPTGVIVPACCSGACVGMVEQARGAVGGWEASLVDKMSTTLLW